MEGYRVPFQDAESEFTEKRSQFISNLWRVESEAEARAKIEGIRKARYDARHHCWCYLIQEGGVVRYSDDGEPQGTAGQPMLNVFQREGVTNVCCVVTRYFGGILLGAGGLTRAYARGAKDALDAAGTAWVSLWTLWDLPCPYPLLERVKLDAAAVGAWSVPLITARQWTSGLPFPRRRTRFFGPSHRAFRRFPGPVPCRRGISARRT